MRKIVFSVVVLMFFLNFYTPVEAAASKTYGQVLQEIGLIQGNNGDIKEKDFITREEMTALLVRISGKNKEFDEFQLPEKPTFVDVPADHWAAKYIEFAYMKRITGGIGDNKFGLGEKVNYNQASLFMIKNLDYYSAKDIDYKTASKYIAETYGLKLENRTIGKAYLQRGQVFELLAKSLAMKPATATGLVKVDIIGLTQEKINTFHKEMKTAQPFYDESKLQTVLKGEFIVTHLAKVTESMVQVKKGTLIEEDYNSAKEEELKMKRFVDSYLNSDYTELPLSVDSIGIKPNEYEEKEIEFQTPHLGLYNSEIDSHGSKISIRFYSSEDTEFPRFGVDINSVTGSASTGGEISEIRQYQNKEGLKVFAVFGEDEYEIYSDKGERIDLLYPFYVAFVVDENGYVVECIASTAYGTGYHNYGKRYSKKY